MGNNAAMLILINDLLLNSHRSTQENFTLTNFQVNYRI